MRLQPLFLLDAVWCGVPLDRLAGPKWATGMQQQIVMVTIMPNVCFDRVLPLCTFVRHGSGISPLFTDECYLAAAKQVSTTDDHAAPAGSWPEWLRGDGN
jgi:hypothetical protein